MNENYTKNLLELMKKDTEATILNQNSLRLLQLEIDNWLELKAQLDRKLELRLKEMEDYERRFLGVAESITLTGTGLRSLVEQYTRMQRKIKELQDINDISTHFKKGYSLIEHIREIFTGQEIVYSIIYSNQDTKEKKIIYETNLTMEQLLPHLSITMKETTLEKRRKSLSNSMIIYLSSSSVAKAANDAIEKDKENAMNILSEIKNPILWDSLVEFQKNKYSGVFKKDSNYKGNLGNLYEVYTNLTKTDRGGVFNHIGHYKGDKNTIGLASSLLDAAISNSIPFYQGGDYGLTQLKAVLGSSTRGLADVGTIERTLQKLQKAFKSSTKEELSNSLKRIFTPAENKINEAIDKQNREDAIAMIDKTIREANFDIE